MSKKYNTLFDKISNKLEHEDSKLCYKVLKSIYTIKFGKKASKMIGNIKYKTIKQI